jgi:UDP-glucose 4-epimerase
MNIARALIAGRPVKIDVVGIRPGEKMHEILVSEEEAHHCVARGKYYAIRPMLPELADDLPGEPNALSGEYSSADAVLDHQGTMELLKRHKLLDVPEGFESAEEMLR